MDFGFNAAPLAKRVTVHIVTVVAYRPAESTALKDSPFSRPATRPSCTGYNHPKQTPSTIRMVGTSQQPHSALYPADVHVVTQRSGYLHVRHAPVSAVHHYRRCNGCPLVRLSTCRGAVGRNVDVHVGLRPLRHCSFRPYLWARRAPVGGCWSTLPG